MRQLAEELGRDGLAELVASFWQDAGALVERFRGACESGDVEAMAAALHTLKGAAANLGIAACVEACDWARASLREHGAVEAPALASALLRAVRDSERALSASAAAAKKPGRRRARR
jgi:HPt (histidine-containing phosphotransfer) domain-containing protein